MLRPHAIIPANPRADCAVRRKGADALLYTWHRCCCCRLTCICEERWADRSMNPCISKMSSTYVDSGVSSFLPLFACMWVGVFVCVSVRVYVCVYLGMLAYTNFELPSTAVPAVD